MYQFNTVEEALEELKNGKIILVTDDPDRENEGDFICAAEFATTKNILWQLMERDLFVCQCQRSMWKNLEFLKWLQIIQIIMKQLLQFQLMG